MLESLCTNLCSMIVPAVFQEISQPEKTGSADIQKYVRNDTIRLLADGDKNASEHRLFRQLDTGERETLNCFTQGEGDFVIIDDLQAIRICVREKIPFINALLVPKILHFAKRLDSKQYARAFKLISETGYYSTKIIHKAETFQKEELFQFFPDSE